MANTIASAVRYINNDAELNALFQASSYTTDLVKENKAVGAKVVKYRKKSLGSSVLGTYNRETGYTRTNITVEWVEKTLTQDKGNSLMLDKMDGEEAQSLEIASVYNDYVRDVVIPSVDTYRFAAIDGTTGVETKVETTALTASTIKGAINAGIDKLAQLNVKTGIILYISISKARLLKDSFGDKGTYTIGAWNGVVDSKVNLYEGCKVIEVPDAILGADIDFMLVPQIAVAAMVKHQEAEYFDKIAGFGGRKAEIDAGVYHDCWVEVGAEKAVYVHRNKARA